MRQPENSELEQELTDRRSEAPDALVSTLVDRIEVNSQGVRTRRIGGLLAATGVAVIALGASGGGIYAYSSAKPSKNNAGVHINQTGAVERPASSGIAQYGPVPVPPHPNPKPQPPPPPAPPPPPPPPPSPPGNGCRIARGTSAKTAACPKPPGKGTKGQKGNGGNKNNGGTAGGSGGSFKPPNSQGQGSGLPFTGLALWVPVALGLSLFLVGLALRRAGRRRETT
jgi:hypothetical protein